MATDCSLLWNFEDSVLTSQAQAFANALNRLAQTCTRKGKRMIKRKWKVYSHFMSLFLVAANTYWTMNRDG